MSKRKRSGPRDVPEILSSSSSSSSTSPPQADLAMAMLTNRPPPPLRSHGAVRVPDDHMRAPQPPMQPTFDAVAPDYFMGHDHLDLDASNSANVDAHNDAMNVTNIDAANGQSGHVPILDSRHMHPQQLQLNHLGMQTQMQMELQNGNGEENPMQGRLSRHAGGMIPQEADEVGGHEGQVLQEQVMGGDQQQQQQQQQQQVQASSKARLGSLSDKSKRQQQQQEQCAVTVSSSLKLRPMPSRTSLRRSVRRMSSGSPLRPV
mmetsp:Transcript_6724/g.11817  ORF Transcript_6724/g.11817 Transcript_6724/m.11817 type:complete len:261 (+) Transcript_6724:80-862(+)